jgi:hypothetical protein
MNRRPSTRWQGENLAPDWRTIFATSILPWSPAVRSRYVRLPVLLLLAVQMGACVSWQAVSTPHEAYIRDQAPDRVRVTRDDGIQLTLLAPEVRAGAIVATQSPGAVLLGDVRTVEVERISVLRSVGIMLPAALLVAVAASIACGDRC